MNRMYASAFLLFTMYGAFGMLFYIMHKEYEKEAGKTLSPVIDTMSFQKGFTMVAPVNAELAQEDGFVYMATEPIPHPLIFSAIITYEKTHGWQVVTTVHAGVARMGKMIVDAKSNNPPMVPVSILIVKKYFKKGEQIDSPKIELKGNLPL